MRPLSLFLVLLAAVVAVVVAETDFEFVMQFTGSCSTYANTETCKAKGNSQVCEEERVRGSEGGREGRKGGEEKETKKRNK